jgi:hypothetical protein
MAINPPQLRFRWRGRFGLLNLAHGRTARAAMYNRFLGLRFCLSSFSNLPVCFPDKLGLNRIDHTQGDFISRFLGRLLRRILSLPDWLLSSPGTAGVAGRHSAAVGFKVADISGGLVRSVRLSVIIRIVSQFGGLIFEILRSLDFELLFSVHFSDPLN